MAPFSRLLGRSRKPRQDNFLQRPEDAKRPRNASKHQRSAEDDDVFDEDSNGRFWGNVTIFIIFLGMVLYGLHYTQYITAEETFTLPSPDRRYRAVGYAYQFSLSKHLFHQNEENYLPGYYRLYNENNVVLYETNVSNAAEPPRFLNNTVIFLTDNGVESIPLKRSRPVAD